MKTLIKKTASNTSIICLGIISCLIIFYMIYIIIVFYPMVKSDTYLEYYIFPLSSGYNGFKISFILFVCLFIIYLINIYFILIKKGLNTKLTFIVFVLAIILTISMSVTYSFKSTSSNYCSYTTAINDYLILDDEKAIDEYVKYFPYKEEVLEYEYYCNRSSTQELEIADVYFNTSVYITIRYTEEKRESILNEYKPYTNKNNDLFTEVYYLSKVKEYTMYVMFNESDSTIIYAFETSSNDIFDKNNEKNIIDYIEKNRSNPF